MHWSDQVTRILYGGSVHWLNPVTCILIIWGGGGVSALVTLSIMYIIWGVQCIGKTQEHVGLYYMGGSVHW